MAQFDTGTLEITGIEARPLPGTHVADAVRDGLRLALERMDRVVVAHNGDRYVCDPAAIIDSICKR